MSGVDGEVTREKAAAATAIWAHEPTTVSEVRHAPFNEDTRDGGVAFLCDRGLVIYAYSSATSWSVDPGDASARLAAIEAFWRENQHRHRPLGMTDVNEWHRAAIAALVAGADSVGQLPESERPGITDIARADYLYVFLQRHARDRTQDAALRALAANDWILEMAGEGDTAHPCPVCGRPAIGRAWSYDTICDACYSKPVCREGRAVRGHNTSIGGGFEAVHVDDTSVCDQVSDDGTVWIDGVECHMGEAKFGGVFVGAPFDNPVRVRRPGCHDRCS